MKSIIFKLEYVYYSNLGQLFFLSILCVASQTNNHLSVSKRQYAQCIDYTFV